MRRLFCSLLTLGLLLLIIATVAGVLAFDHYSNDLPDYSRLKDYQPPILSHVSPPKKTVAPK